MRRIRAKGQGSKRDIGYYLRFGKCPKRALFGQPLVARQQVLL